MTPALEAAAAVLRKTLLVSLDIDLDQLELEAGQRPIGHGLGQFDAAQEGCQKRTPDDAMCGLVAVWCRSFDSVMCDKGDEPWAQ